MCFCISFNVFIVLRNKYKWWSRHFRLETLWEKTCRQLQILTFLKFNFEFKGQNIKCTGILQLFLTIPLKQKHNAFIISQWSGPKNRWTQGSHGFGGSGFCDFLGWRFLGLCDSEGFLSILKDCILARSESDLSCFVSLFNYSSLGKIAEDQLFSQTPIVFPKNIILSKTTSKFFYRYHKPNWNV